LKYAAVPASVDYDPIKSVEWALGSVQQNSNVCGVQSFFCSRSLSRSLSCSLSLSLWLSLSPSPYKLCLYVRSCAHKCVCVCVRERCEFSVLSLFESNWLSDPLPPTLFPALCELWCFDPEHGQAYPWEPKAGGEPKEALPVFGVKQSDNSPLDFGPYHSDSASLSTLRYFCSQVVGVCRGVRRHVM